MQNQQTIDNPLFPRSSSTTKSFVNVLFELAKKSNNDLLSSPEKEDPKFCTFCKIIAGELPCIKIYENDDVLAFLGNNSFFI